MISDRQLIKRAKAVAKKKRVSNHFVYGDVGCALVTDKGRVYVGCCMDAACGIGFCAEHGAIAAMLAAHETKIRRIVAVSDKGVVLPPCGRCREFIYQVTHMDPTVEVIVGKGRKSLLGELLPQPWQKAF